MNLWGKVTTAVVIWILGITFTLTQDDVPMCKEMGCDKGKDEVCIFEEGGATNPGLGTRRAKICPLFLRACDPSCPPDQTCINFGGECRNKKAKCVPTKSIMQ